MTVSSEQSFIEYNGNGSTQTFAVPFYFILNSDISVTIADPSGNLDELTYGVDYSASGGGNPDGGTATLNTAYASGYTILIYRNPPETQETAYYENGKFPAKSHEKALDKLTMLIQKYGWWFDSLALKKPSYLAQYYDAQGNRISNLADPVNNQDAATKNYVDVSSRRALRVPEASVGLVPPVSARANHLLAFNNDGNPISVLPESGSAADVLIDLASSADGKGDNLVAHGKVTINDYLSIKNITEYLSIKLRGNQPVRIELFGDSTMWGAWQSDLSQQSPQEPGISLYRAIGIIFGTTSHSVSNRAISGTSLQQMLDGTDGSGETFEQRVNASSADVIYCNHAMNDMQSNSDLSHFEKNIIKAIEICINAGKLFIYCTPNAVTTGPTDIYLEGKPLRIQWFSDVIKKVCSNYGIPVVDNNYFFRKTLMSLTQSAVLSDGVHPTDLMYEQMGFNLAIPFVKCNILRNSGDSQPTSGCDVFAGPVRHHEVFSSSRFGSVIYADGSITDLKKISIPFIYDSDLDIKIVTPMFSGGPASVGCVRQSSYDLNINHTQLPAVPGTLVSNEFTVIHGGTIPCGLVVITIYINNVGAKVGLEGVVIRDGSSKTVPITAVENGDSLILRDIFVDTQIYTTGISFSGVIGKNCGIKLMVIGQKDSTSSQSRAIFGLNASGHPVIGLLNSSGDYDLTELNVTDYSTATHSYALAITSSLTGSINAYVDGVRVGGLSMSNGFLGGNIGLYSSLGSSINLTNVSVMSRL